jgi:hypothetical protein
MDHGNDGVRDGWDIPGILRVVHMEQPYGLVDFVQQTSRGDHPVGEVVGSAVVMDRQKARLRKQSGDMKHLNHQAIEWFVESLDCRVEQGELCDIWKWLTVWKTRTKCRMVKTMSGKAVK